MSPAAENLTGLLKAAPPPASPTTRTPGSGEGGPQTSAPSARHLSHDGSGTARYCLSQLLPLIGCRAIKSSIVQPQPGRHCRGSDVSACWLVSETSPHSAAADPRAHAHIQPGRCTRGQSRTTEGLRALRAEAACLGDPGQLPRGPLECTGLWAMTGTSFLWDSCGQPCWQGDRPLNWDVEHTVEEGSLVLQQLCRSTLGALDTLAGGGGAVLRQLGHRGTHCWVPPSGTGCPLCLPLSHARY